MDVCLGRRSEKSLNHQGCFFDYLLTNGSLQQFYVMFVTVRETSMASLNNGLNLLSHHTRNMLSRKDTHLVCSRLVNDRKKRALILLDIIIPRGIENKTAIGTQSRNQHDFEDSSVTNAV